MYGKEESVQVAVRLQIESIDIQNCCAMPDPERPFAICVVEKISAEVLEIACTAGCPEGRFFVDVIGDREVRFGFQRLADFRAGGCIRYAG